MTRASLFFLSMPITRTTPQVISPITPRKPRMLKRQPVMGSISVAVTARPKHASMQAPMIMRAQSILSESAFSTKKYIRPIITAVST